MPLKTNLRFILLSFLSIVCMLSRAENVTIEKNSFTKVVDNLDENISYKAEKGAQFYTPDVFNNAIRIYQNSGIFTIYAKNDVTITAITIGSVNETLVTYACDDKTPSSDIIIKENKKLKLTNLTVKNRIVFTCTSHVSSGRLNINYLSVTYKKSIGNNVILDENATNNTFTAGPANITLRRTFNADAWNTLVLPFAMTREQIAETFGTKASVANYIGSTRNADNTYTLNFDSSKKEIEANKPVFIYDAVNKPEYRIENAVLVEGVPVIETTEGFNFAGSYNKSTIQHDDWFISSDNKFYQAAGSEIIKPFRALFRPVSNAANAKALAVSITDEDGTLTVINAHSGQMAQPASAPLYNISGQCVNKRYKGIVIQNGKKTINR